MPANLLTLPPKVQGKVLPKYGLSGDMKGVLQMLDKIAPFAGDWMVANRFYAPRDDSQPPVRPSDDFESSRDALPAVPPSAARPRKRQPEAELAEVGDFED